jgi:hypothetical protein
MHSLRSWASIGTTERIAAASKSARSHRTFHRLTPLAAAFAFWADPRRAEGSRRTSVTVRLIRPNACVCSRSRW